MPLPVHMADSIAPRLIPPAFRRNPNGVLVYVDGPHAWGGREVRDFANHWGITVTGDPALAHAARCIDCERYDATPADVAAYAEARAQAGKHTIVYCSRDTIPAVVDADQHWQSLEWFIATLDGIDWTAEKLAEDIKATLNITLDPGKIRANQNVPGPNFDTSRVFGDPGWAHPVR